MEKVVAEDRILTRLLHSPQTQLEAQNSRIQQLFQKVAQQQRHLEKQHLRIQNLQSQVPVLAPDGEGGSRWTLWVWLWSQAG